MGIVSTDERRGWPNPTAADGPTGADGRADTPKEQLEHRLLGVIDRVGRGDEQAFDELYDLLAGLVHGLVLRVLRDPAQSQEVTQEVFLEIWRQAPRFDRSRGKVRSWAAVIAHRRAVDRVRSEQARGTREERDHQLAPPPDPPTADPVGEAIDRRFDRERVRRALFRLSDVQRQAVELAYFKGYSYRQVAVALDTPEGTVKTRIRDGMIRLRDELGVTT